MFPRHDLDAAAVNTQSFLSWKIYVYGDKIQPVLTAIYVMFCANSDLFAHNLYLVTKHFAQWL